MGKSDGEVGAPLNLPEGKGLHRTFQVIQIILQNS